MPGLMERLRREALLVADGAWGTELIRRGLDVQQEPADWWNLSQPRAVAEVAAQYAPQADILSTNTFGANRIRLAHFGLEYKIEMINGQGVEIAREALHTCQVPERPLQYIAGAMGPARGPGRTHPHDDALAQEFREQASHLAEAGSSFLLLETMTDLREALIAVKAARSACALEIVCSFAFRETAPGHFETWSGHSVEEALISALEAGAVMAGANCVAAKASLLPLVDRMREAMGAHPLWLKPNAGQPRSERDATGHALLHYPHPLRGAPLSALFDALGTGVIGGCCGTTPEDIARLRQETDRRADQM